jgi:hypothetical protein
MSRFVLAVSACLIVLAPVAAVGPYDDLLPYVPPHCNTLVLLNVKAAYDSPLAKSEKWSEHISEIQGRHGLRAAGRQGRRHLIADEHDEHDA